LKRRVAVGGFLCVLSAACGGSPSSSQLLPTSASVTSSTSSSGGGSSALGAAPGSFGALGSFRIEASRTTTVSIFESRDFSAAGVGVRAVGADVTAPGAPGTLSATVTGSTVTLVWSASNSGDPVISYILEAGSASSLANLANAMTNSTATTFVATGVGSGTYYVRVRAQNSGGAGPASNEVVVAVGSVSPGCTSAPGAPGGLVGSVTGGTVVLNWDGATGSPTTYVVEAGSSSGLSDLANSDLGGIATTLTATGVGSGTYYLRTRARNACGSSPSSNELVLTVGGSSGLVIQSWAASLYVRHMVGTSYETTGQIDMVVSTPVVGAYRAAFDSFGQIGAGQRFVFPTRNLSFFIYEITNGCPDLHGTKPLVLYNEGGARVASVQATLRGSGCAFSDLDSAVTH
jgi:hypothetical protein